MLKLHAVYKQHKDERWDAFIAGHEHITVYDADDLETARVILKIITAEEVAYMSSCRADWDIVKETINYFNQKEGADYEEF